MDRADRGFDRDGLARSDVEGAGLFEDRRAAAGDRLRQAEQVPPRVELGLVLHPDRALRVEGQGHILDEAGRETQAEAGVDLVHHPLAPLAGLRVGVGRLADEVAVDPEIAGERLDRPDRALVRVGVPLGAVLAGRLRSGGGRR